MSKAFLKDDAQDEQIVVSARPPLPPGTPNYVTSRGLKLLNGELAELTAERTQLQSGAGDALERARRLAALHEHIEALRERLASAELVRHAPQDAPQDEVGFGATVTTRALSGKFAGETRRLTIVGVDEAAAEEERVAFVAPIARALMGHRVGDSVPMQMPRGKQVLEVAAIDYEIDYEET